MIQKTRSSYGMLRVARFSMLMVMIAGCVAGCGQREVNYAPPPGTPGPAINHYSFSRIVVDGKEYIDLDIAILAGGKVRSWRMHTAHQVEPVDLVDLIGTETRTLIIGTGAMEETRVSAAVRAELEKRGITLHVLDTFEAVNMFNRTPKLGVAACFHTAC